MLSWMRDRTPEPNPALVLVLVLVAGGLLALGYALDARWWAAWLAPAPALAALLLSPPRWRPWLGLAIGLASGALTFGYHITTGSLAAALVIAAAYAFAWSSTLRLAATAAERLPAAVAALVLPTGWAAIDTLLIHISPHGSAGSLAYSQAGVLPVLQVASLGGVPAITFVILLPGSVAGLALARVLGRDIRGLTQATTAAGAIVGATLLFGLWRLEQPAARPGPAIAMIASDRSAPLGRRWSAFIKDYGSSIDHAARRGVTVLLPEAALRASPVEADAAAAWFARLAADRGTTFVAGIAVDGSPRGTNRALVITPDGERAWYVKQHLVPGLEDGFAAGNAPLIVSTPVARSGIAICKDMHFPTLGREYAGGRAKLMLVPALDFDVDDRSAMAMTVMRGIEGGFSIARATRQGYSFVSDPFGRIVAERRSGPAAGLLLAHAPGGLAAPTLYARVGDLFGWVCVAGLISLWIVVRQRTPAPPTPLPAS
ncbi:MAG: hypothetical protein RL490_1037 [Pseudomonadota bacterium]|jgi:apolipoprotein N-acyltransferase